MRLLLRELCRFTGVQRRQRRWCWRCVLQVGEREPSPRCHQYGPPASRGRRPRAVRAMRPRLHARQSRKAPVHLRGPEARPAAEPIAGRARGSPATCGTGGGGSAWRQRPRCHFRRLRWWRLRRLKLQWWQEEQLAAAVARIPRRDARRAWATGYRAAGRLWRRRRIWRRKCWRR